jgi:hypothetical protein
MGTRYFRAVLVLAVLLFVSGVAPLGADAAVIKNKATGETLTGTLTDQSINGLRVFVIAGSERKKFLNMDEWEVVAADAATASSAAPPTSAAKSPEGPASSVTAEKAGLGDTSYVELPMAGVIGKDVTPTAVRDALKVAAGFSAIKHIVVRIKTAGGQMAAAKEICDLMKSYEGRFAYHAIVEQAAGAGLFVAFSCQTINMADGATFGGAAADQEQPASGAAGSDAKATATPADELAAIAEAGGRSGVLAKAMTDQGAKVYAWKDNDGKIQIADHEPAGIPAERMIVAKAPETVLTLTSSQAVALGLAKPLRGGNTAVAEDLGMAGCKPAGCNLAMVMRQAREREAEDRAAKTTRDKKSAENTEKRKKTKDIIDQNVEDAAKIDPKSGSYTYTTGTLPGRQSQHQSMGINDNPQTEKRFDQASFMLWQDRTDKCLADWNNVLAGIKAMLQLEKEADGLGLDRSMDNKALSDLYDKALAEVKRLNTQRNNNKDPSKLP